MQATMYKMEKTYSQAAFDKFVASEIKSMKRYRAKGHRDFKNATDEQIQASAIALANCYNVGQVFVRGEAV